MQNRLPTTRIYPLSKVRSFSAIFCNTLGSAVDGLIAFAQAIPNFGTPSGWFSEVVCMNLENTIFYNFLALIFSGLSSQTNVLNVTQIHPCMWEGLECDSGNSTITAL